jgi:hypothetical protein
VVFKSEIRTVRDTPDESIYEERQVSIQFSYDYTTAIDTAGGEEAESGEEENESSDKFSQKATKVTRIRTITYVPYGSVEGEASTLYERNYIKVNPNALALKEGSTNELQDERYFIIKSIQAESQVDKEFSNEAIYYVIAKCRVVFSEKPENWNTPNDPILK